MSVRSHTQQLPEPSLDSATAIAGRPSQHGPNLATEARANTEPAETDGTLNWDGSTRPCPWRPPKSPVSSAPDTSFNKGRPSPLRAASQALGSGARWQPSLADRDKDRHHRQRHVTSAYVPDITSRDRHYPRAPLEHSLQSTRLLHTQLVRLPGLLDNHAAEPHLGRADPLLSSVKPPFPILLVLQRTTTRVTFQVGQILSNRLRV